MQAFLNDINVNPSDLTCLGICYFLKMKSTIQITKAEFVKGCTDLKSK